MLQRKCTKRTIEVSLFKENKYVDTSLDTLRQFVKARSS